MLELGSIDMTVVQRHTGNTPLLLLAKVIGRDSAEAAEVAGAAPCRLTAAFIPPPLSSFCRCHAQ